MAIALYWSVLTGFIEHRKSNPSMRIVVAAVALSLLLGARLSAASNLPYFISIDTALDSSTACQPADRTSTCSQGTVFLGRVVEHAIKKPDDWDLCRKPSPTNGWNIRKLQIEFEQKLDEAVKECQPTESSPKKSLPEASQPKKRLSVYAVGSADPDQDLDRLEEYLHSMQLLQNLLADDRGPLADTANERTEVGEQIEHNSSSQWCGNPLSDGVCKDKDKHHLYKLFTFRNQYYHDVKPDPPGKDCVRNSQLVDFLLCRLKEVTVERDRYTRFIVLGYEIPWDKDGNGSHIRYGVTFFFEDKVHLMDKESNGPETQYLGYALLYANEATPAPFPLGLKDDHPHDRDPERAWWEYAVYGTGWPFAVAVGLKNAAFEVVKAPFSLFAGLLFGAGQAFDYPKQNFLTARDAIQVEASDLPRYGVLGGIYHVLTEIPLVGPLAAMNTGPKLPYSEKGDQTRKVFVSRGIYGGDKWGQDTGLWATLASRAYHGYDVYSPPYRHGTVTDVIWSMFNLSHGPGYSEAKYVMDHASRYDHLYLAGHSGGVQRSAAASRILVDHGYSVVKVLGIAGPSIGQAYVDTRYPNAFRIFLNTETGANQDVTSKVGVTANVLTTILDWTVLGVPKYVVGGLAGRFSDTRKRDVYTFFDHLGYANATVTQVDRKPSTRHHTPFRESLSEPVVFDAYVRSEFASAFRGDLERPDPRNLPTWIEFLKDPAPRLLSRDRDVEQVDAFPWQP